VSADGFRGAAFPVTFPGYPPGPASTRNVLDELGALNDLRRDVLGVIGKRFATYGDFFYVDAPDLDLYHVCHPDLVHDVLVTQARAFRKRKTDLEVLGEGLLTSDGEAWRLQRRRIQPGFRHESIQRYARLIVDEAEGLARRLEHGNVIDLRREMMQLTLHIVCRALFGQHFAGKSSRLSRAMTVLQEQALLPKLVPPWVPSPLNLLRRYMLAEVDREVFPIIDRGGEPGSLLADLIALTDAEGAMTRQQLRDEVVTLFLAGHETTALALTWIFYELALHPEIAAELEAELDQAPRDLAQASIADFPLTQRVLYETLRLYPPAYVIPRVCAEPLQLGGYRIEPGAEVWMWVYFMHHDARWFSEPERFRPERFLERKYLPYTFLPFGGGVRRCLGAAFAETEMRAVLAAIVRTVRVDAARPESEKVGRRVITLVPGRGAEIIAT